MIEPHEYALDQYYKKEDERAEQLEEFEELSKPFFDTIEESIFHIRNKAESFSDIDLEEEIKQTILEML